MIDIRNIRPGQIATFRMEKEGRDTNLRKTLDTADGRVPNPLLDRISQHTTVIGNVAGRETYRRKLAKRGDAPKGRPTWWEWTEQDGIARHKTDAERGLYVVVSPTGGSTFYLVDGREPTPEEAAVIEAAKGAPKPKPDIICMSYGNLTNIVE